MLRQAIAISLEEQSTYQANIIRQLEEIQNTLGIGKYEIQNVPADGDCLLHSLILAFRVIQHPSAPLDPVSLRKELVNHMRTQELTWFQFATKVTKTSFLRSQSKKGTCCDENVVKAAAELYQRTIAVTNTTDGRRLFDFEATKRGRKPSPIELVLVNFNHYMFACPVTKTNMLAIDVGAP